MITLTREEAQQVLYIMESTHFAVADNVHHSVVMEHVAAIETLRARLSAPEPEPLEYWNAVESWVKLDEVRQHFDSVSCGTIYKNPGEGRSPLYTAPPQREWRGLSTAEVKALWNVTKKPTEFADLLQAKLREKNERRA